MLKKWLKKWLGIEELNSSLGVILEIEAEVEEIRHLQDKYSLPKEIVEQVIALKEELKEMQDEQGE